MDLLTLGAALLAGLLTFLNPCVLPVLPIVFGAAANEHRYGPLALAGGLALSFTAVGLFVATIGFSVGLDAGFFRQVSAALLIGFGMMLAIPRAQYRFKPRWARSPLGRRSGVTTMIQAASAASSASASCSERSGLPA